MVAALLFRPLLPATDAFLTGRSATSTDLMMLLEPISPPPPQLLITAYLISAFTARRYFRRRHIDYYDFAAAILLPLHYRLAAVSRYHA
jgi:hypothetical protein